MNVLNNYLDYKLRLDGSTPQPKQFVFSLCLHFSKVLSKFCGNHIFNGVKCMQSRFNISSVSEANTCKPIVALQALLKYWVLKINWGWPMSIVLNGWNWMDGWLAGKEPLPTKKTFTCPLLVGPSSSILLLFRNFQRLTQIIDTSFSIV